MTNEQIIENLTRLLHLIEISEDDNPLIDYSGMIETYKESIKAVEKIDKIERFMDCYGTQESGDFRLHKIWNIIKGQEHD